MKKKNIISSLALFIIGTLTIGIIPIILFYTSIRNKIPSENRLFFLMFFEAVIFLFFLNLIYSNKKQLQPAAKIDKPKCSIYFKLGKYVIIFLVTAVLSYALLGYNNKLAMAGAFVPVFLLWIYQTFKK